jgi:hypothetical protein
MEFVPKNVHWLLPDEPSPCDVLLHFRGQFATAICAGQPVTFKLLEKLAKTQCSQVYIRAGDQDTWNAWSAGRYPAAKISAKEASAPTEDESKQLYGNKRAELISYVQKTVQKRVDGDKSLDASFAKALLTLKSVAREPGLDWYFKQFHEPPDLFNHNARVAYSLAIFCGIHPLLHQEETDTLIYSALIHELEGNPVENIKTVVSQQTLALFEKRKDPVPKKVIQLIEMHDELSSGKGFPNNLVLDAIPIGVRIFTLFNHFDQYRIANSGTRRARFDKTKQLMEARQNDYDPGLWPLFWDFWEKKAEAVS